MRLLKNKTAADVGVSYGTVTVIVEAGSQRDLSETFEFWQLASSQSLIELLGQGVEKYQLNDGQRDLSVSDAIDLIRGFKDQQLIDPQGAPYVSLLLGTPGLKLCIKGVKFDAPVGQTTNNDVTFAELREIQGSWLEVSGWQAGDYVEMSLVAPDGTTILGQFGETVYIPPDGQLDPIVAEGTVAFPPTVRVRLAYTAVNAGSTRTVYGWHRMRK